MGRWLRPFLVSVLLVCGAALVFSQDQAAKPEWKEYAYADDGFALTAPSKPTLENGKKGKGRKTKKKKNKKKKNK